MPYHTFRVTAQLASPIAGDPSLPLDGPLLALAMRERYGPLHATIPGALDPRYPLVDLPLTRLGEGDAWYYACTWAQWPSVTADGTQHWVKAWETDPACAQYLDTPTARVPISGGRYRAYRMPVYTRHACTLWWRLHGDRDWCEAMLTHLKYLGKKTSQGYGRVERWTVEPEAGDWSLVGEDGTLLRAVPRDGGRLQGIRPPYWLPAHQVPCVVPG